MTENSNPTYIYTYNYPEEERDLCMLEMRSLFGQETDNKVLKSMRDIEPSRSPFIKEKLTVLAVAETKESLYRQLGEMDIEKASYKVIYIQNPSLPKVGFDDRRQIEKETGIARDGEADLEHPDHLYGIFHHGGKWMFGDYLEAVPIWHNHQKKPHDYSIALNTRVARTVANIAVPNPDGTRAIDPCCGIGTVLVEAASMGMDIIGSDRNLKVLKGARENLEHFGYETGLGLTDISDVTGHYDAVIIDMPYNVFSAISEGEKVEMLRHAKRLGERVVIITMEPVDVILKQLELVVTDRAVVKKGKAGVFAREVIVCQQEKEDKL